MSNIVNTNVGAWAALQNLSASQRSLGTLQTRINSGLSVSSTKDDSAVYNLAQSLRGDVGGLAAVGSSLSTAKSVVDVAVNGAESINDILNQMKSVATKADDGTLTDAQRGQYDTDFKNLQKQIDTIVKSSNFNGINLLKDGGGSVSALKSLYGGGSVGATTGSAIAWSPNTLEVDNVGVDGGSGLTATGSGVDLTSADNAKAALGKLADDTVTLGSALSKLGSAARTIDSQLTFNSKLTDTLNSGIGNLVDADLAKESANLQALQVKQQLGIQALSIANQAPQTLLSLFRG
ncbi:flagellin [Sphingomonas endophytica]|uniref:Flagellin n=1 Tax=Sphingomonas endophytica TaxID=869719 RepID=A0A7X0JD19_9SPHN|nr:flagellin [Sphingomonas endophytica]MBB5725648.1 flagellin [Sphingomonas endophytica]MBB6505390.1 flagellin [Sphingomonas endophytica]